jgi:hypothetical protein
MYPSKHTSGFIALLSILILSTVLLATTLTVAERGITERFANLYLEHKEKSEALAHACVAIGRIFILNDPQYAHSDTRSYPIEGAMCDITRVTSHAGYSDLYTHAVFERAHTALHVTISHTTGDIQSIVEEPSF